MDKNRLDILKTDDGIELNLNSIKIKSLELTNYRFFYGDDKIKG